MKKYNLLSCVWELTLKCNLKCIHCGSAAGKKRDNELSKEEALNLCEDLKKTGCKSVALMGGEPLLSDYFFDVACKIRELSMDLCVITNGTVFSDDIIKKLKDLNPQAVATSLDGAKSFTHDRIRGVSGSFDKTLKFIEKCLEYSLPVSVITTVSKINISELNDIKEMIKGRKIAWQIQVAGSEGNRFDKKYIIDETEFYSAGIFIETLRRNYPVSEIPVIGAHDMGYNSCFIKNIWLYEQWPGCQAGISVVGIRSNGDVMGCLSINDERFVEGNVREKKLYDIWNSENHFEYSRKFKKSDAGENCKNCHYIESCKGGCSEMSLSLTGKLHNDPYCFYMIEKKKMNFIKRFFMYLGSYVFKITRNKNLEIINKIFTGVRK